MEKTLNVTAVEKLAYRIRRHIIETVIQHGEGHAGPSLSCTDIVAVLYGAVMNYKPNDPKWEDRDKFILSAGHKCLCLYGALVEANLIEADVLNMYNKLGSVVPAHPDMKKLPGVEFSTGSLGHGLPLACGIALSAKLKKQSNRIFVLMGDGEQGEGSVWEAASYASAKGLDNIVGILDRNGLQINGTNKEICDTSPLEKRYAAFGWSIMTVDGHNVKELYDALNAPPLIPGKPNMIICNTIKSKGMPFAENNVKYHHWDPDGKEAEMAMKALDEYEERWLKS